MKSSRTNPVIIISSIALLIVLLIQVNWIVKTAKIKEELFNEKANMILSRTTDAISSDKETCREIVACMDEDSIPGSPAKLRRNEVRTIDSLLQHYMQFYNFSIEYSFVVTRPDKSKMGLANAIYGQQLGEMRGADNVELKLILPDKKQYIMAEMGPLFMTTIILILIVLVLFWQTVLSLQKEKLIAEHTSGFLNNMTHEFKTPLTNIGLAGKMLVKENMLSADHKVKHYAEIILDENEKLRLQVEQVLSMAAMEKGEIPFQMKELDMHQTLHDVLKCMSVQIESSRGTVMMDLGAKKFMISGDRTQLTNALCNIIDNAVKYAKDKPQLKLETRNEGDRLVIMVSDKGIGIKKEYQPKVFDRFFRVPTGDVHDVKGFGMGLAYVKRVVEMHGGSISLKSETGRGARFTIILPNG